MPPYGNTGIIVRKCAGIGDILDKKCADTIDTGGILIADIADTLDILM